MFSYIAHLATASSDAVVVSLADKLHNARCILADRRALGEEVWNRFSARKDQVFWYYRELLRVFQTRSTSPLVTELSRVITETEDLAYLRAGKVNHA